MTKIGTVSGETKGQKFQLPVEPINGQLRSV